MLRTVDPLYYCSRFEWVIKLFLFCRSLSGLTDTKSCSTVKANGRLNDVAVRKMSASKSGFFAKIQFCPNFIFCSKRLEDHNSATTFFASSKSPLSLSLSLPPSLPSLSLSPFIFNIIAALLTLYWLLWRRPWWWEQIIFTYFIKGSMAGLLFFNMGQTQLLFVYLCPSPNTMTNIVQ